MTIKVSVISRKEVIDNSQLLPVSLAKGRLSSLFDDKKQLDDIRIQQRHVEALAAQRADELQRLANLTPEKKLVHDYDAVLKELANATSSSAKKELAKQVRS